MILKLSSQRQLTLPKAVVDTMGKPSYFKAELVNKELRLRPGLRMSLEEAELRMGQHGLTQEVLREALLIVAGREKDKPAG